MISITVNHLTKRFGSVIALGALDLQINPGELFFLLGPSGCGKTTLLRCLAGFYIPDEGSIRFGREDVTRLAPHKRNAGMVFQSYALWPHMTVAQNVAFGLKERKVAKVEIRKRVGEALESARMSNYADRKPNELSGGQQQRVALARALIVRPRCLLLDEPLSNLDARLRLEMRGEIRRVCKAYNLTTVYVTHDQKEALSIADRMAILDEGRVLQVGSPREIYARPHTRTVAHFIGETNLIEGRLLEGGETGVVVETKYGLLHGTLSDPSSEPGIGTGVAVSIRPECFRFETRPADKNSIPGKVVGCAYLGEVAEYRFHTASGVIRITELNPRFIEARRDRELFANVSQEDVLVLTR